MPRVAVPCQVGYIQGTLWWPWPLEFQNIGQTVFTQVALVDQSNMKCILYIIHYITWISHVFSDFLWENLQDWLPHTTLTEQDLPKPLYWEDVFWNSFYFTIVWVEKTNVQRWNPDRCSRDWRQSLSCFWCDRLLEKLSRWQMYSATQSSLRCSKVQQGNLKIDYKWKLYWEWLSTPSNWEVV